jgi:hypothetical protein
MTTIYTARVESRNFSFEAYGETPHEAMDVLRRALRKHASEYRVDNVDRWLADMLIDVQAWPVTTGTGLRDGHELCKA